jgi:transposase
MGSGVERLGALVREKMLAEPRSRALFVFVGKRGHTMKVLTWDGTGTIVIHKKLDAGRFELPGATAPGELHLRISDAMFDVIHKGVFNGGVVQWLTNGSGAYAVETVSALDEIGARHAAATVRSILAFFEAGAPPHDPMARAAVVEQLLPSAEAAWRQLGDRAARVARRSGPLARPIRASTQLSLRSR